MPSFGDSGLIQIVKIGRTTRSMGRSPWRQPAWALSRKRPWRKRWCRRHRSFASIEVADVVGAELW